MPYVNLGEKSSLYLNFVEVVDENFLKLRSTYKCDVLWKTSDMSVRNFRTQVFFAGVQIWFENFGPTNFWEI